jgi:hypothetical protein
MLDIAYVALTVLFFPRWARLPAQTPTDDAAAERKYASMRKRD